MRYTYCGILFSLEKQGLSDFFFPAWLNFEDIIIQAKKKDISSKTNMLHVDSDEVFEAVTPKETENRLSLLVLRLRERAKGMLLLVCTELRFCEVRLSLNAAE